MYNASSKVQLSNIAINYIINSNTQTLHICTAYDNYGIRFSLQTDPFPADNSWFHDRKGLANLDLYRNPAFAITDPHQSLCHSQGPDEDLLQWPSRSTKTATEPGFAGDIGAIEV